MSFALRPAPSTPAASKTNLSSRVCAGNAITMTCGSITFVGVAHPLFDLSSRIQAADRLDLYSWGFLTMIAPADSDTKLGSASPCALAPPAAAASTAGDAFSLFAATLVVGVGWVFPATSLVLQ